MYINNIIGLDEIVEKNEREHQVFQDEVEEVFYNRPKFRKGQKGKYEGEDLYYAYGRTDAGRYLFVVFIYKKTHDALIISARDMDETKGDDMPKNKKPIPDEFKSIAEIQDFWDENSSADYWDDMEDVDLQLSPSLKARLELKKLYSLLNFSSTQIAAIEAKAKREKVSSKQIISKWILEHV